MLLVLVLENVNGSGKNSPQTLSDLSNNYVPEDPAQVGVYIWPNIAYICIQRRPADIQTPTQ